MHGLGNLIRHELGMGLRRRALWIAYAVLFVFHTVILFSPPPLGEWVAGDVITPAETWSAAGRFLAALNVFFPVIAGILSADRLRRDFQLGMRELQESTPLRAAAYALSKYLGALAACLLPLSLWVMAVAIVMVAIGHAPPTFVLTVLLAFLAISLPAFAFVVAFSIACPLVMPLSMYQVLFTGYWFWANFIPPRLFPTLNGTLFTPNGLFASQGFFGAEVSAEIAGAAGYTAGDAVLNLLVLATCVTGVLTVLTAHLRRQARLA